MDFLRFFTDAGAMESRAWYESQALPFFAPPSWAFGVAWGIIYPLIAAAFVLTLVACARGRLPRSYVAVFCVNAIANLAFSPLQFGLQSNLLAAIDIAIVLATTAYLVWAAWRMRRLLIALLLAPYLAWVSFATVLQLSVTALNW